MDVQTPVKKKRSPDYFAETSEKAPRPAVTKIEEVDDKKQEIHQHEKDFLRVINSSLFLCLLYWLASRRILLHARVVAAPNSQPNGTLEPLQGFLKGIYKGSIRELGNRSLNHNMKPKTHSGPYKKLENLLKDVAMDPKGEELLELQLQAFKVLISRV